MRVKHQAKRRMATDNLFKCPDKQFLIDRAVHLHDHAHVIKWGIGKTHLVHPDTHLNRGKRMPVQFTEGGGSGNAQFCVLAHGYSNL